MAAEKQGRRFAISDVHGCATTFSHLLHKKLQITPTDTLYLIGDLINRGPDSKGVLKKVMDLRNEGVEVQLFRGNHEAVLLDACKTGNTRFFKSIGGKPTLKSFGIKKVGDIPEKYLVLLREGKFYHIEAPFIFVHAGFNFSHQNIFEDKEAMLWIKRMTIDKEKLGEHIIIHGHTPWSKTAIKAQFKREQQPRVINIDGGCVYNRQGSRLVALNIDTMELTFVKNREDRR